MSSKNDSSGSAVHVTVEMKKGGEEGGSVHYKHDGERFSQGQPNTVKLNVSSPYTFTLTFRPAKVLTHWLIRGEKVEFDHVTPSSADDDVSVFRSLWSSVGLEVTKRAERYPLAMEIELYPGCVMKTVLQAKFYQQHETTHSSWGPEIHSLEYKCQIPDGQTCVDILHQKII